MPHAYPALRLGGHPGLDCRDVLPELLLRLASAQVLMTLASSVIKRRSQTVAKDAGMTVTGIQAVITFFMPGVASLMITGGKPGADASDFAVAGFLPGRIGLGCHGSARPIGGFQ